MTPPLGRADLPLANLVLDRRRAWLSAALFNIVLTATILLFFRYQVANGFSVLFSDRNDGVIADAILEHWHNVLRGNALWSQLYDFYPYDKTLAYTEGFFLFGLIHALFRGLGFDPLLSSEFVNIVIKGIGFAAFYGACRRIFALPQVWALFGAALFTLSHASFVQAGHAQLFSVAFAPLMALLLWESYGAAIAGLRAKLTMCGTLAGLLFGAWMLTAFYMAWFFLYFIAFFLIALVMMRRRLGLEEPPMRLRDVLGPGLMILAVTAASMLPFAWVYLAKARETGVRGVGEALSATPGLADIVNIGPDNLLFGRLYGALVRVLCPECSLGISEYTTGIEPLLLILLGCAFVWLWRARLAPERKLLLGAVAAAILITWGLSLHIGPFSGWYLVYYLFPGAKALRAIPRYQIFLAGPIVVLVLCYLSALAERVPKTAVAALCAILLLGEINTGEATIVNLARAPEIERLHVGAPPPACHAFFATPAADQDSHSLVNAVYPHNVDAMMIAELVRLPTINGFASFTPADWDFAYPNNADYPARVETYAARHELKGLCQLDLAGKSWREDWREAAKSGAKAAR